MQDCLPAVTISVLMECTQLRTTRVEVFIDEGINISLVFPT